VFQQARLQESTLAHPAFNHNKEHNDEHKAHDCADHISTQPCLGHAALLQSKELTDNGSHDGECAQEIYLEELLLLAGFHRLAPWWCFEEEENGHATQASDRKVNVETEFENWRRLR
jgi:hypothetical protein